MSTRIFVVIFIGLAVLAGAYFYLTNQNDITYTRENSNEPYLLHTDEDTASASSESANQFSAENIIPDTISAEATKDTSPAPTTPTFPTRTTDPSLSALIGQLFMIGHWANTPISDTTNLIRNNYLGGVIIMSAPSEADQIKTWTNTWRNDSPINLIIAIDQEGTPVTRLRGNDFIQTSQREITTSEVATAVGQTRGIELTRLGINMNFAPVLDSAYNPASFMYQRVFPSRENSATLADAMINGMKSSGVIGVAKHFPGHDDTEDDSHFMLPLVNIEKSELNRFTAPFRELIDLGSAQALMTAHVALPKIDPRPATLSRFFLTDYLRGELGFKGVIITDDMSMKAITDHYHRGEAAVLALEAGADMILFAAEPQAVLEAIEAVEAAVQSGRLSRSRLEASAEHLSALRP